MVIGIVGWELLARSPIVPSSVAAPSQVWQAFIDDPGSIWFQVHPTLLASVQGFALAAATAFLVAGLTVAVPRVTGLVYSVSVITYSMPLIALAPLLIVWIGNGSELRIMIAAIAGFFPVLVGCIQGFRSVDRVRTELFLQLSASGAQRFRHLVVPESLPHVFGGLKVGAASAVLGAIISEWTGATRGLGFAMLSALSGYDPPRVWLSMVAATALTILLYQMVGLTERLAMPWRGDRDASVAGS